MNDFDRFNRMVDKQDQEFQSVFRQSRAFFWIVTTVVVFFFIMSAILVIGLLALAYRAWW
jgi:hypothetical protein